MFFKREICNGSVEQTDDPMNLREPEEDRNVGGKTTIET